MLKTTCEPQGHVILVGPKSRTTVICGREQSDQMTLSKALKPIHHTFMRPDNKLEIIVLTKLHDTVRLEENTQKLSSQPKTHYFAVHLSLRKPQRSHKHELVTFQAEWLLDLPQRSPSPVLGHLDVNPQHCHFLLGRTCKTVSDTWFEV